MSRSVKVKPKFTDQRDRLYLALLGTSLHEQRMEEARVRTAPFALPQLKDMELKMPLLPDLRGLSRADSWESSFGPAFTTEQRQALECLGQLSKESEYRCKVKALPSSTGGIVIDLVKDKREKAYVRKETTDEQDLYREGWDLNH